MSSLFNVEGVLLSKVSERAAGARASLLSLTSVIKTMFHRKCSSATSYFTSSPKQTSQMLRYKERCFNFYLFIRMHVLL